MANSAYIVVVSPHALKLEGRTFVPFGDNLHASALDPEFFRFHQVDR